MAFADILDSFAAAVRTAEHGSDEKRHYLFYGDWLPKAGTRLLGAYKIPANQWAQLAQDAGVLGADWRDPAVQDAVAKHNFARLYGKYQSWEPVAVAWKAGEDLADAMVDGQGVVADIPGDMGKTLGTYVSKATTGFDAGDPGPRPTKRIGSNPAFSQAEARPVRPANPPARPPSESLMPIMRMMKQGVQQRGAAVTEEPAQEEAEPKEMT